MKNKSFLAISILLAGFTSLSIAQDQPPLVELFTSQGCSSCPPAEKWLNNEGMKLFREGKIIPLAFHVDYWDYLGWKDPFSSKDFTERQKAYAETWKASSLYTPQMVVSGKVGFVGSDRDQARQEIVNPQNHTDFFPLDFKAVKTRTGIRLSLFPMPTKNRLQFWVALFENGLTTKVERAENAGRTLFENFVVRYWAEMPPASRPFVIPWNPACNPGKTGLVVVAQDGTNLEIKAVKCRFPLEPPQENSN